MAQNRAALMCLAAALLMGGCGGELADTPSEEPSTMESASQALYPEYDPEIHCLVWSKYVSCHSGPTLYAYYSEEWGYYIERNACGRNGPLICPLY